MAVQIDQPIRGFNRRKPRRRGALRATAHRFEYSDPRRCKKLVELPPSSGAEKPTAAQRVAIDVSRRAKARGGGLPPAMASKRQVVATTCLRDDRIHHWRIGYDANLKQLSGGDGSSSRRSGR
jgi:hypothetical protein